MSPTTCGSNPRSIGAHARSNHEFWVEIKQLQVIKILGASIKVLNSITALNNSHTAPLQLHSFLIMWSRAYLPQNYFGSLIKSLFPGIGTKGRIIHGAAKHWGNSYVYSSLKIALESFLCC